MVFNSNAKYGLWPVTSEDVDPKKHTIIDGEFTVLNDAFSGAHNDATMGEEKPLYFERDGLGGLRPVYEDKPPGRSFTV